MDTTPNSEIKKSKTSVIIGAALILLVAGCALLTFMLINENAKNEQLQELAELDKMEMELQYEEFDQQYN